MKAIYDISPPISSELAVWPGDVEYSRKISLDVSKGDHLTLSSISSTLHLGAHADGPNHYGGSCGIGQVSLEPYWGVCQVVTVDCIPGGSIVPEMLQTVSIYSSRILFHTNSFPDPTRFNSDFMALSPELIEFLQSKGVRLVGIDTPSIDLFESKELPTHHAVLKSNMAVLEGIVLNGVPDGDYELSALPLSIQDGDASPVRAALRALKK